MDKSEIPPFPLIRARLEADGSAHVTGGGRDFTLPASTMREGRQAVTQWAVEVARGVGRPVRLTTTDPDGTWELAAHPDGKITELESPSRRPRQAEPSPGFERLTPASDPAAEAMMQVQAPPPEFGPAESAPRYVSDVPGWNIDDDGQWARADEPGEDELAQLIQDGNAGRGDLVLEFDEGPTLVITGTALIGRKPVDSGTMHVDELHAVDDPGRTVSRTHVAIIWVDDVPHVVDQHSANGTWVGCLGDHSEKRIRPGDLVPLHDGDHLRLGDTFTATVHRPVRTRTGGSR